MHTPFDLVLFDLDGTLVETAPEICDAVNDTLRRFNLPEATLAQVAAWIGHGTRELLIQALAQASGTDVATVRASGTLPLIAAEFDRHYAARCGTRSQPYPHVVDTLHTLRAQGVKLAVVTNKEGVYTRRVLDAHSLTPLFDRVVSGDSLPSKKPDPAGAKGCMAELCVSADRTLFVGDSSIDAATARNAGVRVWLLPYGYNMGKPVSACKPDRVIADLRALLSPTPLPV
ncbi:phosphoglycolate phosphatase [Hydrogenophaga atypica]|uniref:phosphoglycolate phosphatase n=1 Tax=Hydrogenophaga atypica TaxID=249409 RepID=A0ABW2QP49_9BURK